MKTTATKQLQTETVQPKANKQAGTQQILQRYKHQTAQLQAAEEEELLQGKFETAQRMELDEEEPLQGKFESIQRMELDEEELLQGKFETAQLATEEEEPLQRQPNNPGLPDNLKSGIENLSGYSMDDVKVHYNSSQPATLQAHAYAQGTDIHIAPGQEKHLPHEAWHVVQQKQGRVKPTMQMKGNVPVNDDAGLEKEADVMGAKAMQSSSTNEEINSVGSSKTLTQRFSVAQLTPSEDFQEFVDDTMIIRLGVQDYEKKIWKPNVKAWSKAEDGLEAWVTETTEAGQRKYAEWRTMEKLIHQDSNLYFGSTPTEEADLESPYTAVEVKRTIQGNSGINSHLLTADQQLYNRHKGNNNNKVISLEIGEVNSMWPWNGNATKLVQDLNTLKRSLLNVLKKIPEPVQVDQLLVSYMNGHANGKLHNIAATVHKYHGTITDIHVVVS